MCRNSDAHSQSKRPSDKTNRVFKSMALNLVLYLSAMARHYFNCTVDYVARIYWGAKRADIPDIQSDNILLMEGATALAHKIRTKVVTSQRMVNMCIDRIKEVNGVVNAMTAERFEVAIREAEAADELIASGSHQQILSSKPYLGVPFTAKESFSVKGMVNSLGLKSRKYKKADEDAEAVRLMREAGAILVAVTNVPEVNRWQETYNMLHGLTTNPFDSTRTVGGSSGGEAALVAAAASPFGLCTDIGGSTRMPAYFCGLFGHNPTAGVINMRGASLRSGDEKGSMVSAGVISRRAEDLIPLMRVLAADRASELHLDAAFDPRALKVFYVEANGDARCSRIHSELKHALRRAVEVLSDLNEPAQRLEIPHLNRSFALWKYWMTKEPADFASLLMDKKGRANGFLELFKKVFGMSDFTLASIVSLLDASLFPAPSDAWALSATEEMKTYLTSKLGKDGVLVFPSAPRCAPHHYTAFLRPWDFAYWAVWNALRFPATQVPLGLNSEGLPMGVQIVAAANNDGLAIRAAQYLEEHTGGFVPPCRIPA